MAEEMDGWVRERRRVGDPDVVGGEDDRAPGSPRESLMKEKVDFTQRPGRGACAVSERTGDAAR